MEFPRLPRFKRAADLASARLTARDHRVVGHIFEHRFVNSHHLASLLDGSRQGVLRRLQRLYHQGYLDRPRAQIDYYRRGSRPMVYGLGNKGMRLLEETLGFPRRKIDWTAKNRTVTRFHLEHTLAVADVMVAFELACRRSGLELLNLPTHSPESPKWKVQIAEAEDVGEIGVVPDRVFGLRATTEPADTRWFFLEVDRATMPVQRNGLRQTSFHRKLVAYHETWRQGVLKARFPRFRVLTVTTTPDRVRNLVAASANLRSGHGLFLFTDASSLKAHGDPLTHVWQSGRAGSSETLV